MGPPCQCRTLRPFLGQVHRYRTARSGHRATLLPSGKVRITGSINLPSGSLDGAEIFDPSSGTFTSAGKMTTGRFGHTTTLLHTGRVLIAGGSDFANQSYNLIASAELYDPPTGTFSAVGNMIQPKWIRTSTLLANGKVLIGGEAENFFASAELYDPDAGMFSVTGAPVSMDSAYSATASLLPNGRVLETLQYPQTNFADAFFSDDAASREANLYDPATGTFTSTTNTSRSLF